MALVWIGAIVAVIVVLVVSWAIPPTPGKMDTINAVERTSIAAGRTYHPGLTPVVQGAVVQGVFVPTEQHFLSTAYMITSRPRTPTPSLTPTRLPTLVTPTSSRTQFPWLCNPSPSDSCLHAYMTAHLSLTQYWQRWTPDLPSPFPTLAVSPTTTAPAIWTLQSRVLTSAPTIAPLLTRWAEQTRVPLSTPALARFPTR